MKKCIVSVLLLLAASVTASAQNSYDLYKYSLTNRQSITSRAASMGGAFTSLGADPATMVINPAGMAFYEGGEISISPSVRTTIAHSQSGLFLNAANDYTGGLDTKTSTTKFNLNNFNAVLSILQNDYKFVRGITFGLAYNLNAINTVSSDSRINGTNSIANFYANTLNSNSITPGDISSSSDTHAAYLANDIGIWGAMNAVGNRLIGYDYTTNRYAVSDRIASGDQFNTGLARHYRGNNSNYDLSIAAKFGEYVSVGVTVGIANYNMATYDKYREMGLAGNGGNYVKMDEYEETSLNGIAFDLKAGFIVEPFEGFKIGGAYHAPRTTKMLQSYLVEQTVNSSTTRSDVAQCTESAVSEIEYKMVSPHKILAGASYDINGFGIVSVDYQRVLYGTMKFKGIEGADTINQEIKETYKATDAFYFGVEAHVGSDIYLRGGANYITSPFENHKELDGYDESTIGATGGIGYRVDVFYVDLAYIYSTTKHRQYQYYADSPSPIARNKVDSHIITVTVGWRF